MADSVVCNRLYRGNSPLSLQISKQKWTEKNRLEQLCKCSYCQKMTAADGALTFRMSKGMKELESDPYTLSYEMVPVAERCAVCQTSSVKTYCNYTQVCKQVHHMDAIPYIDIRELNSKL